jgi:hypothetical protein
MQKETLRRELSAREAGPQKREPVIDDATRETVARQSAERYRREIADVNRSSDRDMDRAFRGS